MSIRPITYIVQKGDALIRILKKAREKYSLAEGQNLKIVASQSGITNPNLIRPGEVITIYVEQPEAKTASRPLYASLGIPGGPVAPSATPPDPTGPSGPAAPYGSKEYLLELLRKFLAGEIISKQELLKLLEQLLENTTDPALKEFLSELKQLVEQGCDLEKIKALVAKYTDKELRIKTTLELLIQLAGLKENETGLTNLIKRDTLDPASQADAQMMLAQNLANQGYIAEALDLDSEPYFTEAEDWLDKANRWATGKKTKFPNAPWPNQIIARFQLTKAKIHLVRAGAEKDRDKKEGLLAAAEAAMLAFDKNNNEHGEIVWAELSLAYQTWGDLLVAKIEIEEGNKEQLLEKAGANYDDAIKKNPRNYEAMASRGDVYNWQEDYAPASAQYGEVLSGAKEGSTARQKAQLGRHEALLRDEDYKEIAAAEKLALEIIINETDASFLIPRAAEFLLEIADAYMAQGNNEKATALLNIIIGNETAESQRLKHIYSKDSASQTAKNILMMRAYFKLGQMAKADDDDEKAKSQVDKALELREEIIKYPEYKNLSEEKKIGIDRVLAEAYAINKEYAKAIEVYRALLEKPYPYPEEDDRSQILLSIGNIYISEWPGADPAEPEEKEKLEKAEFYFRMAATFYYGEESKETAGEITNNDKLEKFIAAHKDKYRYDDATKTLIVKGAMREEENNELLALCSSPDEIKVINSLFSRSKVTGQAKLIYARALLGLGEMRRYGNDKHQKTALKYYSKALKVLGSIPEGRHVREKNAVACKAHYGKAKSYEVLANKVEAQKESDAAIALIKNLPKAEHGQVRRNYARTRDPIAARFRQAKGVDEYGNTWVEHQYETEASIPVAEKTVLKVTDRYNTAKHATIHSTYVGVEQQVAEGVAVRVDGKVPGSELKLESGEEVRQFSNPDVALQMNIEKEHYSGSARGEFYFNRHWNQLNAYSADSYWKEDLKNVPLIKKGTLRLGVEANYYTFPYEDTFPTKLEVNPTIKFDTDLFGVIGWGYDIVRLNLMAQLVTKTHIGELEPGDKYRALIGYGFGLGMDVDLTHLILLMLRSHADAPSVIFSANYRYKEDPRFTQSMFTMDANLAPLIHWLVDKAKGR